MANHEIKQIIALANQYLSPTYNEKAQGGIEAQMKQEEGVFSAVVAEIAKKDQTVLKIWKEVKKAKNGN